MMKHSFAEIDSARYHVDRQNAQDRIKQSIQSLCQKENCSICSPDLDHYYDVCVTLANFRIRIQVSATLIMYDITIKA